MTTRMLAVGAASLAAGALAAGAATANAATTLSASLDTRQEVPSPTGVAAGARGGFTASVTAGPRPVLRWRLTFARLSGRAVQAHVHLGRPGRAGPVAVALCGPCRSGARGSARISAAVRRALLNGTAYVNVHTARNPAGEIRGRVGVLVRARLTVGQERPAPAVARGGSGSFTGRLFGRQIAWTLSFRTLTGPALQAHIHLGRRGVAGPVAVALCGPCRSGRRGTSTLTRAQLRQLTAGRTYVNVHTAANAPGEIRGQLRAG